MPKKILLADDSITIQKVVELTFSDGDYEVIAVNNGAKAIQKLSEIRPDIILSDIIMPEKNGYEVCEFVKSHPEFRTIPVVLLTGTFEPFDPDRADKAGCDAVVTKPFESQSLIHKVEELIAQGHPSEAPAVAEPASPWTEQPEPPAPEAPPPVEASAGFGAPEPFAASEPHDSDIFGAATPPASASLGDMPFETAPAEEFSGETRAFPRMSFEDMQRMASVPPAEPEPAPPAEHSPWDEQPAFSGETRAFPRMSFDDLEKVSEAPAPAPAPAEIPPWDEQPAASAESKQFEAPAFEDIPTRPPAEEAPAADASPWEGQQPAFSGETRAFPRMNFEDLQKMASEPAPQAAPEPPPAAEPSPWDEQPAFGGETRAFPRMSFDDLQKMAAGPVETPPEPARDSPLWEEPAPAPSWASETPAQQPAAPETFAAAAESPFGQAAEEESPFAREGALSPFASQAAVSPFAADEAAEPAGEEPAAAVATAPSQPAPAEPQPAPLAAAAVAGDLTDEQIDRIARRVVQLMTTDVVRNIAWEVIPDMAEMVVKERIRQLETEA